MAVRRNFMDLRDGGDPNAEDDYAQGPAGTGIVNLFDATGGDAPGQSEGDGGVLADRSGVAPGVPSAPGDVTGGEGNRETPREVFGNNMPTTPSAPSTPASSAPDLAEIMSLLPQSVEASPEQAGTGAGMAPMASASPNPASARTMAPGTVAGTAPSMPARQAFSSPSALFAGGSNTGLSRQGGGFGLPGMGQGQPKPTEQMLQLLRQLGLGQ